MTTTSRKSANASSAEQTDLQAAAALVLEREEKRKHRLERRRQAQARKREKEQLAAVHRMQQSIEVMKWCIASITAIMFVGIVIAIWTLSSLHAEVVKVQAEVEEFRPGVERVVVEVNEFVDQVALVRESLRNPMQSVGTAFGKQLDEKLQNYLGNQLKSGE